MLMRAGLELEVFAGLGLYPTYVLMQGFSASSSVILLSLLNVYASPFFRNGMVLSDTRKDSPQSADSWPAASRTNMAGSTRRQD